MTQINSQKSLNSPANLRTWLFNPFYYLAGSPALFGGLILILLADAIGAMSHTHFDGVLDLHTGRVIPFWLFLTEGFIDWLVMGILLLIAGWIISSSHIRPVDVFGTQALARGPSLISALVALVPGYQRYCEHLAGQLLGKTPENLHPQVTDPVLFVVTILVIVLMMIWMVLLMYRAFGVSCNVKGGKAIGVFIAVLLLGEAASKFLIIVLFHTFM